MHERVSSTHGVEQWRTQCARMVARQLERRGIEDPRVLQAMQTVPRHGFVDREQRSLAYADHPLSIGHGQTISQPFIVAQMAEAARLQPTDRVLEIGTGSGYSAAVLSQLCGRVFTVERYGELADAARVRLAAYGYDNVVVRHADGARGWPEHAPYDAILVTAAAQGFPTALVSQLAGGGRMIVPLPSGITDVQDLMRLEQTRSGLRRDNLGPVRFVPLVGSLE